VQTCYHIGDARSFRSCHEQIACGFGGTSGVAEFAFGNAERERPRCQHRHVHPPSHQDRGRHERCMPSRHAQDVPCGRSTAEGAQVRTRRCVLPAPSERQDHQGFIRGVESPFRPQGGMVLPCTRTQCQGQPQSGLEPHQLYRYPWFQVDRRGQQFVLHPVKGSLRRMMQPLGGSDWRPSLQLLPPSILQIIRLFSYKTENAYVLTK
jgi:hypothetical protein